MLTKAKINNFLKIRKSGDLLYNIKNIIILTMVKYYKDMDIITLVDGIDLKLSKNKEKIMTTIKNKKYVISINEDLSLLNKIEYIVNEINYIYNVKTPIKEPLKEVVCLLQTEDVMKQLFKIIRLNSIEEFQDLSSIDSKTYRCYIRQGEVNLLRPIYNYYKKNDKNIIKSINNFIERMIKDTDQHKVQDITKLYIEARDENSTVLEASECYRQIKDIANTILKDINN